MIPSRRASVTIASQSLPFRLRIRRRVRRVEADVGARFEFGLGAIICQGIDTRTTSAPSARICSSVPAGSACRCTSSSITDSWVGEPSAGAAGMRMAATASTTEPSSSAAVVGGPSIYFTVTFTDRL